MCKNSHPRTESKTRNRLYKLIKLQKTLVLCVHFQIQSCPVWWRLNAHAEVLNPLKHVAVGSPQPEIKA